MPFVTVGAFPFVKSLPCQIEPLPPPKFAPLISIQVPAAMVGKPPPKSVAEVTLVIVGEVSACKSDAANPLSKIEPTDPVAELLGDTPWADERAANPAATANAFNQCM